MRAYSAALQILPIARADFPEDLHHYYDTIVQICDRASERFPDALPLTGLWGLPPSVRDQFTDAVVRLFEAAAQERGRVHGHNGTPHPQKD